MSFVVEHWYISPVSYLLQRSNVYVSYQIRFMFTRCSVCLTSFVVILQEDTTRSHTSSGGKVKILANSPCTKLETPKVWLHYTGLSRILKRSSFGLTFVLTGY